MIIDKQNFKSNQVHLSIVIIAKNEEFGIKRCLDSILKGLSEFNNWEIILVDSDSKDSTVEIAQEYPCDIYKIQGKGMSASLGRFIGTEKAVGDLILYLDGDMELCKGWLVKAISELENDKNAAGIIGIRSDKIYNKEKQIIKEIKNVYSSQTKSVSNHFGGAFLAKKRLINQVGGYDPRMLTNEEPELHSRIIKADYHVLQIPINMVVHHDDSEEKKIHEKIFSTMTNKYMGLALGFKYSIKKGSFYNYFIRMKEFLIPIILDIISVLIIFISFWTPINDIYIIMALQIISFLFVLLIGKPKRYFQSKFMFISFVRSLFSKVYQEYNVEKIN